MARFNPGDKVWIHSSGPPQYAVSAGKYPGVIYKRLDKLFFRSRKLAYEWYAVEVFNVETTDGRFHWAVPHIDIYPRDDDYDGNKLTSWENLPFQPKKEEA